MSSFNDTLSYWTPNPDETAFEVELMSRPVEAGTPRCLPAGAPSYDCTDCGFQGDDQYEYDSHCLVKHHKRAPGYTDREVARILLESPVIHKPARSHR